MSYQHPAVPVSQIEDLLERPYLAELHWFEQITFDDRDLVKFKDIPAEQLPLLDHEEYEDPDYIDPDNPPLLFETFDEYATFVLNVLEMWLDNHIGEGRGDMVASGNWVDGMHHLYRESVLQALLHYHFERDYKDQLEWCHESSTVWDKGTCDFASEDPDGEEKHFEDSHEPITWEQWWEDFQELNTAERTVYTRGAFGWPKTIRHIELPDFAQDDIFYMDMDQKVEAIREYWPAEDDEYGDEAPMFQVCEAVWRLKHNEGHDLFRDVLAATAVQHYGGLIFQAEDDGGYIYEHGVNDWGDGPFGYDDDDDYEEDDDDGNKYSRFVDRVRNEGPAEVWGEDHIREWLERNGA